MKRILIIEDDESHLMMLKAVLKKEKYEVIEARNGNEGCNLFFEEVFDLVICDIFMPDKEGLETITELKEYDPNVKIIAISGGGIRSRFMVKDVLHMAKDLGAINVMPKPIDIPEMLTVVKKLLQD